MLGVEITPDAAWPSEEVPHHVRVELPGGLSLEIDSVAMTESFDGPWGPAGGTVTIIFTMESRDSIDELYGKLTAAGHTGRVPPFDAFWGARYAVVDDPDGNHVGLMSPMDERYASAPPPL
jgi:uncharacterized glyoxalase superfamily protein PhnB